MRVRTIATITEPTGPHSQTTIPAGLILTVDDRKGLGWVENGMAVQLPEIPQPESAISEPAVTAEATPKRRGKKAK